MRTVRALAAAAAAIAASAALGWSHVRLHNPANKKPLYWANPGSISVVLQAAGSDDLDGAEEFAALRAAIRAWNEVDGTTARLVENQSSVQQARTDWASDDLHSIVFDETNASGYFPFGSGVVAITPIWFTSQGKITDADVLFNGASYHFTTSGELGRFDVADVGAHELGHLLGLDHSGSAGATLYPYVDPSVVLHRSVSADDAVGLRCAYPEPGESGALVGNVARASNGDEVPGALVVALDASGRQAASVLSDGLGAFELEGLAPGTYRVYARPLDGPVSSYNLTTGWSIATSFEASALGTPVVVAAGAATQVGEIAVPPLHGLALGSSSDAFPLRATSGETTPFSLHGAGLLPGVALACSDPAIDVTAVALWGGLVQLFVDVPVGHATGNYDLVATSGAGELARLPGALEVVPPEPQVDAVSPSAIDSDGGTVVLVEGSAFRSGLHVALGDRIYAQGSGLELVDAQTLRVTTAATADGVHDLVVVDASGVEGRLPGAVQAALLPSIETIFPTAGTATGGTELLLRGEHYADGVQVRIDGQPVAAVEVLDDERVRIQTPPGAAGGPYLLELEIAGGAVASGLFAYANEPDPQLASIEPSFGAAGDVVTVSGLHFTPDMAVVFGADPETGLGGVAATDLTVWDDETITVVVPALSGGAHSVMVCDAEGQAVLVTAGFDVDGGDGGGGGCAALASAARRGPPGAREILAGTWWLLAALALGAARARHARSSPSPVSASSAISVGRPSA
ncbi:MAG: matrixin family metalloprotease [Planctomycetota bacterium]|nr:MAG: matrixin family metalloprotease [Planctomycetota bacterium]